MRTTMKAALLLSRISSSSGETPANSAVPEIDNTSPRVGDTLTRIAGVWSGSPSLTLTWERDGTPISGATATTYVVTYEDVGAVLTITEHDSLSGTSATSDPTDTATWAYDLFDGFASGTIGSGTRSGEVGSTTAVNANGDLAIATGAARINATPASNISLQTDAFESGVARVCVASHVDVAAGRPVLQIGLTELSTSFGYNIRVISSTRIDMRDNTTSISNIYNSFGATSTLAIARDESGRAFYLVDNVLIHVTLGVISGSEEWFWGLPSAVSHNLGLDTLAVYPVPNALLAPAVADASPTTGETYVLAANGIVALDMVADDPLAGSAHLHFRASGNDYFDLYLDAAGALKLDRVAAGVTAQADLINVSGVASAGETVRVQVRFYDSSIIVVTSNNAGDVTNRGTVTNGNFTAQTGIAVVYADYAATNLRGYPMESVNYDTFLA